MKVELTLAPAGPAAIQSLVLDVPIKDDMAPLWHVLKTNIRSNPAGKTPGGAGEVWNSKKLRDGNLSLMYLRYRLWRGLISCFFQLRQYPMDGILLVIQRCNKRIGIGSCIAPCSSTHLCRN
jgi:hypothetical protein